MTRRAKTAIATAAATIATIPAAAARRCLILIPSLGKRKTRVPRMTLRVIAALIGSVVALLLAVAAYLRSRAPGGFYDREVYGMTPAVHRRYAAIALGFALAFAAAARWFTAGATIWLYAAFVLFAVFYLTSYLRGASEDDD